MKRAGNKSRYAWFAVLVFWMALIFHFSNQRAAESAEISGSFSYRIVSGVRNVLSADWEEETVEAAAVWLEHPLRKAAHMTEYAVLAWICLGNCMQYLLLRKKRYVWAWLAASCYAATDEFHQLFIEGRSGEIRDVAIDSMGALLGLLLLWKILNRQR